MPSFRIFLKKIIIICSLSSLLCKAAPDLKLIERSFAEVCIEYQKIPQKGSESTLVGGAFLDERTLVIHDPFLETNPEYKDHCRYSIGLMTQQGKKVWVHADRLFRCRVHDLVFLTLNASVPVALRFSTQKPSIKRCGMGGSGMQLEYHKASCKGQLIDAQTVAVDCSAFTSQPKIAGNLGLKAHIVDEGYGHNTWTNARLLKASEKNPQILHFQLEAPSPCGQPASLITETQENEPIYAVGTGREDNYSTELGWIWEIQKGRMLEPHAFSDLRRRNVAKVFLQNPFKEESYPLFDEHGALVGLSLTKYQDGDPHTVEVIPAHRIKRIYEFIKEGKVPLLRSIEACSGAFVKAERIFLEKLDPTLRAKAIGTQFLVIEQPSNNPLCPPSGAVLWSANGIILGNTLDILFEEAAKGECVELVWLEETPSGYLERSARLKTRPHWPSL